MTEKIGTLHIVRWQKKIIEEKNSAATWLKSVNSTGLGKVIKLQERVFDLPFRDT